MREGGEELVLAPVRVAKGRVRLLDGGRRGGVGGELAAEEQEPDEDEAEAEERGGEARVDGREPPPRCRSLPRGERPPLGGLEAVECRPDGLGAYVLRGVSARGPRPDSAPAEAAHSVVEEGEPPAGRPREPRDAFRLVRVPPRQLREPVELDGEDCPSRFERGERGRSARKEEPALRGLGAGERRLDARQLGQDLAGPIRLPLPFDEAVEVADRQGGVRRERRDGDAEHHAFLARENAHGKIFSVPEAFSKPSTRGPARDRTGPGGEPSGGGACLGRLPVPGHGTTAAPAREARHANPGAVVEARSRVAAGALDCLLRERDGDEPENRGSRP